MVGSDPQASREPKPGEARSRRLGMSRLGAGGPRAACGEQGRFRADQQLASLSQGTVAFLIHRLTAGGLENKLSSLSSFPQVLAWVQRTPPSIPRRGYNSSQTCKLLEIRKISSS